MIPRPETPLAQPPAVMINESERSGGGMGMGLVLGAILVVVVGMGLVWFMMAGKVTAPSISVPPVNVNPTINVQPPNIKIPDTITINPPAAAPVQPPSAPAGADSGAKP